MTADLPKLQLYSSLYFLCVYRLNILISNLCACGVDVGVNVESLELIVERYAIVYHVKFDRLDYLIPLKSFFFVVFGWTFVWKLYSKPKSHKLYSYSHNKQRMNSRKPNKQDLLGYWLSCFSCLQPTEIDTKWKRAHVLAKRIRQKNSVLVSTRPNITIRMSIYIYICDDAPDRTLTWNVA